MTISSHNRHILTFPQLPLSIMNHTDLIIMNISYGKHENHYRNFFICLLNQVPIASSN